jgi:hypothetical protein
MSGSSRLELPLLICRNTSWSTIAANRLDGEFGVNTLVLLMSVN